MEVQDSGTSATIINYKSIRLKKFTEKNSIVVVGTFYMIYSRLYSISE